MSQYRHEFGVIPFHLDRAIGCWEALDVNPVPWRVNARAGSDSIHSGRRPLPSPSPLYSRTPSPPPTDGPPGTPAQQDSTQDCTEAALSSAVPRSAHHLAPVPLRSIPHQRLDVRVMLEAIDCLRYSHSSSTRSNSTTASPSECPTTNTMSIGTPTALADAPSLHDGTLRTVPRHLIGKAKNRLRTHPRSGKGSKAPFFHTLCAQRLPSREMHEAPSANIPTS